MYQQAEWPPLDTFPSYLEVAMVTVGGLVTCSVIVMACTFCPFLRKFKPDRTDGGSDMPPGHYVEEFYANPAFMELPFDGSNTYPSDLPYYEPTLDINYQTNMEKTTSISSTTNHTIIPPKTVVTTVTGPAPYQMEPKYYVQSNACISSTSDNTGNSAIKGAANNNSTITKDDGEEDVEAKNTNGLRLTESLSTDVVYANQGAAESFREQKQADDEVSQSIENLGTVKTVTNLLPHNGDDRVLNSPKGDANKDRGVPTTKGDDGTGQNYLFSWESKAEGEKVLQDDGQEKSGTWNKRVRHKSFDDLYMAGRNGSSQQQPVKKLKVTGSEDSNSDAKRISRTGSRAKRKIRNSFSKVQKPIFRPRRKTIDTRPSTEIIQNPFVV